MSCFKIILRKKKENLAKIERLFYFCTSVGQMTNANINIKRFTMKQEQFFRALEIISQHHLTQISINFPKNDSVGFIKQIEFSKILDDLGAAESTTFTINATDELHLYINKCVPGLIKRLNDTGFSMIMTDQGLEVFVTQ